MLVVYEISGVQRGNSRCCKDRKERVKKFRSLFSTQTSFERPNEFWIDSKSSNFNKYCDFVLNCFSKKWKSQTSRAQYLETFSVSKWEAFPTNSGSNSWRESRRTFHRRCSNSSTVCANTNGQCAPKMVQERSKKVLNPVLKSLAGEENA